VTQVKICGITNEEDALCAANFGAAALGFIFYPPSPRYIEPERARLVITNLPAPVAKVGVFVNESAAEIKRIMKYCGLDFIQLHGDETADFCRKFPATKIIKAVFLRSDEDLEKACAYQVAAILVDNRNKNLYGGTGMPTDWELARCLKDRKSLILSGGLNEKNIRQAVEAVAPNAVDINSGVEITPGRKDKEKMASLMRIVEETGLDRGGNIFNKR